MKRTRHRRTHNVTRIRRNHAYSVHEVAELLGVHKNAVLRWLKQGLQRIDGTRPFLIHGSDLREFLALRQQSRKRRCQPHEFYCCRCRQPRPSWENQADIILQNEKRLNIIGVCAVCGITMNKAGAVRKLPEIRTIFAIQVVRDKMPALTEGAQ